MKNHHDQIEVDIPKLGGTMLDGFKKEVKLDTLVTALRGSTLVVHQTPLVAIPGRRGIQADVVIHRNRTSPAKPCIRAGRLAKANAIGIEWTAKFRILALKMVMEWQGGTFVNELSKGILSRDEIDRVIQDAHEQIGKLSRNYRMGLLTEQDVQQRVRYVFHEVFDHFLDERGVRICVAAKDWNVFSTAVREWKKDGKEYHLQACSWLQFSRDDEAKGFKYGDEAAVADKVLLLEMLEAFHVPIEYYRPVPDGIICPDIHPAHFPGEYWIGEDIWEQDGGLCQGNIVPEEAGNPD